MKKVYGSLVIGMLLIMAVNLYLYYQHYQITHFSCQGRATVTDENQTLNAQISFSLSGDIGQAIINGELIDTDGNIRSVHRSSSFRFKQNGNNFYVTNYSVAELPNNTVDQSTLKTFLPPYLLFNGISTRVDIYPLAHHGYLITGDEYTHFVCEK
ncbi:Uncharacterised protein [Serratia fonticola]|uniref:hypothetical protein n=1 Tax=Serratia fonticola TaxID=47917 RepID=UPI002178C945|nr:hypothetical protein [Serratia fonticola]CAI1578936.1 Uncharacterised protein [Serratia fonticola]CAI2160865.1 Uncharacterised protein [Serratia fonticola]